MCLRAVFLHYHNRAAHTLHLFEHLLLFLFRGYLVEVHAVNRGLTQLKHTFALLLRRFLPYFIGSHLRLYGEDIAF